MRPPHNQVNHVYGQPKEQTALMAASVRNHPEIVEVRGPLAD